MPLKALRNSESSKTLGLVAGMGELPRVIASEAKKKGYRVVVIALQPPADDSIKPFGDDFHRVKIGHLGTLIALLKKSYAADAVMAGKVPKTLLYKNKRSLIPDIRAAKLLLSLKDRSDDTIMKAVVKELEKEGIKLHNTTAFTKELLAGEGILTRTKPSKNEMEDIKFGWKIAKEMGRLDIGQTVVIKDKAVMAIEAIEGTDEAIKRGGHLAEEGAVVVKVSKPGQDMRFDVPVVGFETLHAMKKAKVAALVVEAGKTIIIDIENFIKEADKAKIAVVGLREML
ncbi:MAG: UDP-2,3-diacylglucosamine diphosphatase LpxI [Nitrospirae bacterium]|nr:UDP-2,3-diacylglucosamine diphosphatase LpxI [Nitrospirota bacterium]